MADCNSFRFAATALNLMRNVPICSSRACCSAPGGSLRAVSKSLAAIFSRSCILSPLHFAVQNTTGFGEALSVRYRTPPLICRTAGKLCKCYAALGLNHRLTGPAHPRHDLLAVVFVAGHDLPAVTVSEREPSLISIQRRLFHFEGIIGGAALMRNRIRPGGRS